MDNNQLNEFFQDFKAEDAVKDTPPLEDFIDGLMDEIQHDMSQPDAEISDMTDSRSETPMHGKVISKVRVIQWSIGMAAVIVLFIGLRYAMTEHSTTKQDVQVPVADNASIADRPDKAETEEFLEWSAPSDYLSDDFN